MGNHETGVQTTVTREKGGQTTHGVIDQSFHSTTTQTAVLMNANGEII